MSAVLDACHAAGIAVMLCTPTATPPRWLTRDYPECLRVDRDGRSFVHGSRQHASHVSACYRAHSRRISGILAREFSGHPAVVAWQLDNEIGMHVDGEFSAEARVAWQEWLASRHGDIATLNRRWGTGMWSTRYDSFADIELPGKTPFDRHPGNPEGAHSASMTTDWWRFVSWTNQRFLAEQAEAIRAHSAAPITHNHVSHDRLVPSGLMEVVDAAGIDIYGPPEGLAGALSNLEWMRGARRRPDGSALPFAVIETAASPVSGRSAAHAAFYLGAGAHLIGYWVWQQQRSGQEMWHPHLITAWGGRSAVWSEVQAASRVIQQLEPLLRAHPALPARVALHESAQARAYAPVPGLVTDGWAYWQQRLQHHESLMRAGIPRIGLLEEQDPSGLDVVLSPAMPILGDALLARMTAWVEAGGLWIIGPLAGYRTDDATVPVDGGLGKLDALLGMRTLWMHDLKGVPASIIGQSVLLNGRGFALEPRDSDCEGLGTISDGWAAGRNWAVRRRIGRGHIVVLAYAATQSGQDAYGDIVAGLAAERLLVRTSSSPGVAVFLRRGAWLVVDYAGAGGWVDIPEAGQDLLSGQGFAAGRRVIPAHGLAMLRFGAA
jgi:beta-galactosidase